VNAHFQGRICDKSANYGLIYWYQVQKGNGKTFSGIFTDTLQITHRSISYNARFFLLQRDFPKGKIGPDRKDDRGQFKETYQCGDRHNAGYGKDPDQTHRGDDRIPFSDRRTQEETLDLREEICGRK